MSRALRMALGALCLIALAACTPGAGDGADVETGVASPWRHWQPQPKPERSDNSLANETQPAVAGPKAVILALHGFNDYSNAFQDVAAYCQERGFAVHAYDQRGFGANPDRGLWPGMVRLTADLEDAIGQLRRVYDDTPLYLLGESMGGAVSIVAATGERPLDVDGIILSAPAVWGGPHMNAFYRLTLWLASTLAPGWTLTGGDLNIQPSDNIEMLRAFSADPLVIKATRTDAIAGLVALMDRAHASAPLLDQRLLLLIGEKDEVIPVGALDDFHSRLEAAEATAIRYPDGYHMLLRDLQRAKVFQDIVTWIEGSSAQDRAARG